MLRKVAMIIYMMIVAVVLTGCSSIFGGDTDLMKPPRLTDEMKEIQDAFNLAAGDSVVLKYPKSGENRVAFISENIDNDDEKEYIVFYQPTTAGSNIKIIILKKINGKWTGLPSIDGGGSDVESVTFDDLDGDGTKEIIVGWNAIITSQKKVIVYRFVDKILSDMYEENYTKMQLVDLDQDGHNDLLVIELNAVEKRAEARYIKFSTDNKTIKFSAPMDGGVTGDDPYAAIKTGLVDHNDGKAIPAVYVDGYKAANTMITEVLYWDGSKLQNQFTIKKGQNFVETFRENTVVSLDINNDGIVEIPYCTELQGYRQAANTEKQWLTVWRQYKINNQRFINSPTNDSVDVVTCVMNNADGYYFEIPEKWSGKITVKSKRETLSMIFCLWDSKKNDFGAELLEISMFSKKDWQSKANEFEIISEHEGKIYAAKINEDAGDEYIGMYEIKKNLKFFNMNG